MDSQRSMYAGAVVVASSSSRREEKPNGKGGEAGRSEKFLPSPLALTPSPPSRKWEVEDGRAAGLEDEEEKKVEAKEDNAQIGLLSCEVNGSFFLPPPVLRLMEWHLFRVWTTVEECSVCRSDLEEPCRYCLASFSSSTLTAVDWRRRRRNRKSSPLFSHWSGSTSSGHQDHRDHQLHRHHGGGGEGESGSSDRGGKRSTSKNEKIAASFPSPLFNSSSFSPLLGGYSASNSTSDLDGAAAVEGTSRSRRRSSRRNDNSYLASSLPRRASVPFTPVARQPQLASAGRGGREREDYRRGGGVSPYSVRYLQRGGEGRGTLPSSSSFYSFPSGLSLTTTTTPSSCRTATTEHKPSTTRREEEKGDGEEKNEEEEEEVEMTGEGFTSKTMWREAKEYVCPVVVGSCGGERRGGREGRPHYFHLHCLSPWWKQIQTFPLSGEVWTTSSFLRRTLKWKDVHHVM